MPSTASTDGPDRGSHLPGGWWPGRWPVGYTPL